MILIFLSLFSLFNFRENSYFCVYLRLIVLHGKRHAWFIAEAFLSSIIFKMLPMLEIYFRTCFCCDYSKYVEFIIVQNQIYLHISKLCWLCNEEWILLFLCPHMQYLWNLLQEQMFQVFRININGIECTDLDQNGSTNELDYSFFLGLRSLRSKNGVVRITMKLIGLQDDAFVIGRHSIDMMIELRVNIIECHYYHFGPRLLHFL